MTVTHIITTYHSCGYYFLINILNPRVPLKKSHRLNSWTVGEGINMECKGYDCVPRVNYFLCLGVWGSQCLMLITSMTRIATYVYTHLIHYDMTMTVLEPSPNRCSVQMINPKINVNSKSSIVMMSLALGQKTSIQVRTSYREHNLYITATVADNVKPYHQRKKPMWNVLNVNYWQNLNYSLSWQS